MRLARSQKLDSISKMERERSRTQLHLLQCLFLLFLFFFCSLPLSSFAQGGGSRNPRSRSVRLEVGVILDTKSLIGNISWSCMRMAVDDFYAANPGYTTRLSLHLRDAGSANGDSFGAASAAVDLLKNVKVQAIIGPQTSSEVKFVMELGDEARVPVISFSAKSPSVSTTENPYFIRAAFNDSTQVEVIASLVNEFNWKQVVPVYGDNEYGNGILPYLIDALQEIDVSIPYRSRIRPPATKDQILKELTKLKSMQTRVFVAHLTYDLGLRLFQIADEEGMLEEGYVWIITYGFTDVVDLMGSLAANVMQGVVGVKPFVNMTNKLREFKQRWRNKFRIENPDAKIDDPTVFGLWAYDTVWALALATEKVKSSDFTFEELDIGNSSTDIASVRISSLGPDLLRSIQSTEFDGMAGKFRLVGGQLQSEIFEIVNVVGNGQRSVGFWSPPHNISGKRNSTNKLDAVKWPGGTEVVPKGWEWPIRGKTLSIGVPVKPGFSEFIDTEDLFKHKRPTGYCIEVFETVMKELPHASYEYSAYGDSEGRSNGTYDDLVYQVFLQKYDAVVGDITIIANRSLYVDFTQPYTESGVRMLVPIKDQRQKGAWTFLQPLTTELWLGSGAFIIFTGFVVWVLEHRINEDFRGPPTEQLGTIMYFSFSTLVFAHREMILNNLSRIVVIVWLFVVLILQSSYTASLTSMLTVEQLQATITDANDLLKNGDYVGYLNDSFMPSLLKRMSFNESKLIALSSPEQYYEALTSGRVAAIFDEIPYLRIFLNKYCGKFTTVGPTYRADGFGFAFPKGSPLVPEVSRAILKLLESDKMVEIERKLYRNWSCSLYEENDTNSSSLTLRSFSGLFLITGVASIAALLMHVAYFFYTNREFLRNLDANNSARKNLILLAKLYDQMKTPNQGNSIEKYDERVVGDMEAAAAPIGQNTPSSISIHVVEETFESEVEDEGCEDSEEEEETSGREISRQNPDPPSFADMLIERNQTGS
ncbi:Glutamate receptor 2.7 [Apostasia shenzhenica]|uniref:Glutamate receptor n=1 Tax=Apostasia shenzhenica TaxID=1088818 RepID=A0A2I0BCC9_9ASPA|nr:Glutamate receptor 2.7 [Apostasia shenzhenica]